MSSFIKDVIRVGTSNILIILFGLGTSILTARFIGPEGNGLIAGLTVYPAIFMSIGSIGIRQSTTYFLGKGVYTENQIKTAITQIWVITSVISLITCFILLYFFSNSGNELVLTYIALLPIPFSLFITYNSGIFLGKNDLKTFNKINWIPYLIVFLSTILFVYILKMGVKGAMISTLFGPLVMFFILLIKNKFIKFFSLKVDWKIIKSMLQLGLIYAVSLFIINLNYKLDIILLDKLGSKYDLGIYSKGTGITQYLWQIPMLFSTVIFARSASSKNDVGFSLKVAQLLRVSLIFVSFFALILILFSDYIIILMYGIKFSESISVLRLLLPGVFILTIYKVMNMDLAGKGKPWVSMKAMIPSLIINIVLNVLLIPKMGANGAALASTVSYSIAGILFLFIYSREVKMPVKEIFNYRKVDFDPIINLIKRGKK